MCGGTEDLRQGATVRAGLPCPSCTGGAPEAEARWPLPSPLSAPAEQRRGIVGPVSLPTPATWWTSGKAVPSRPLPQPRQAARPDPAAGPSLAGGPLRRRPPHHPSGGASLTSPALVPFRGAPLRPSDPAASDERPPPPTPGCCPRTCCSTSCCGSRRRSSAASAPTSCSRRREREPAVGSGCRGWCGSRSCRTTCTPPRRRLPVPLPRRHQGDGAGGRLVHPVQAVGGRWLSGGVNRGIDILLFFHKKLVNVDTIMCSRYLGVFSRV